MATKTSRQKEQHGQRSWVRRSLACSVSKEPRVAGAETAGEKEGEDDIHNIIRSMLCRVLGDFLNIVVKCT